jgi:hypothetical protein
MNLRREQLGLAGRRVAMEIEGCESTSPCELRPAEVCLERQLTSTELFNRHNAFASSILTFPYNHPIHSLRGALQHHCRRHSRSKQYIDDCAIASFTLYPYSIPRRHFFATWSTEIVDSLLAAPHSPWTPAICPSKSPLSLSACTASSMRLAYLLTSATQGSQRLALRNTETSHRKTC